MKAQSGSDSPLQNPTSASKPQASGNPYAPSVPISLYREVSAELQATKALLESANHQNQQLTQQNQQMRQEVERLVQSAMTLQQLANVKLKGVDVAQPPLPQPTVPPAMPTVAAGESEAIASMLRNQAFRSEEPATSAADRTADNTADRTVNRTADRTADRAADNVETPDTAPVPQPFLSDELIVEQAVSPAPSASKPVAPRDMGGLWLAITLIFIVITAFGAGFLVVRPFLQAPNSR